MAGGNTKPEAALYAPPVDGMPWLVVYFDQSGDVIEAEGFETEGEAAVSIAARP